MSETTASNATAARTASPSTPPGRTTADPRGGRFTPGRVAAIAGWVVLVLVLVVGMTETLASGYQDQLAFLGRGFGAVLPYIVMFAVLLVRPSGLFGTRELTRV